MDRKKLQEIINILQDIQISIDLEETLNNNNEIPIVIFRNGDSIKTSLTVDKKTKITEKKDDLIKLLKDKVKNL